MSDLDDLRRLYTYNRWANLRCIEALSELEPDVLELDRSSSYASLLDTLVHGYGAERIWLDRWTGGKPDRLPTTADGLDSVAVVRTAWDVVWEQQRAFLDRLDDATVEAPLTYHNLSGREDTQVLADQMKHVVNHASYHRGQLATMLRQCGRVPPSTDYILWLREVAAAARGA